jgi:hypothetical protein
VAFCAQRRNLRRTIRIALIVGALLTLINQGSVIASGHDMAATWVCCARSDGEPFRSRSGLRRHELLRSLGPAARPGRGYIVSLDRREMIERVRNRWRLRRHPPSRRMSEYLDGELTIRERRALEAHVHDCARCRGLLESLARTLDALGALGALGPEGSPGVAASVIAAVRAESPTAAVSRGPGHPALAVVGPPVHSSGAARLRVRARAALAFCCERRQLRATVPVALLVGVVLSFVNRGGVLLQGHFDLAMCVTCGSNFLAPFLALNAVLLLIVRPPGRRRP